MLNDINMVARDSLLFMINAVLRNNDETIDLDALRNKAYALSNIVAPELTTHDVESVINRVIEMHSVSLKMGSGVVDPDTFSAWLDNRKSQTKLSRWKAYDQLLLQREWSPRVVDKLDIQTDKIVEFLGDPMAPGEWSRRGLAIGEVQSGKTATYIAVLNKAIDYGYKLIIIIGGHTEDLRRQTQRRVDTDLTGLDSLFMSENISSETTIRVGVGQIDETFMTNVLTTARSDFNAASKRAGLVAFGDTPTVFVIKKNAKVLNNLAAYLKRQANQGRHDLPLVVIDDEADWASINTKSEDDVAAVNLAIRDLLTASTRNSYLGITATPFANILIDDEVDDDLFPCDYIQSLESPTNYQGVETYLGEEDHPAIITSVDDCLEILPFNHKRTHVVSSLPNSLKEAISAFYLGTAIRSLRDESRKPSSMMINVSRFNDVQNKIDGLAKDFIFDMNRSILAEFGLSERQNVQSNHALMLRRVFEQNFSDSGHTWDDVRTTLAKVAEEIRVELVNGQTVSLRNKRLAGLSRDERVLDGLIPTIFVGGDVLARGLTLDGLQVSYYVRRAGAADTLLQMGRWFGYRPKYEDLVRIWIDQDVVSLFRYVAELSRDLRDSLREMNALELTPKDFGLRMKRHPESFMITAANKRKHAEYMEGLVSIHGRIFESYALSAKRDDRDRNLKGVIKFAEEVIHHYPEEDISLRSGSNRVWRKVSPKAVESLFTEFRGHSEEPYFGSRNGSHAQLAPYLSQAKNAESWDVVFVNGLGHELCLVPGLTLRSSTRNRMTCENRLGMIKLGNRRLATGSDFRNVLTKERLREIANGLSDETKISDALIAKSGIERPTLLVFCITADTPEAKDVVVSVDEPLVGLLVAFPGLSPEEELVELRSGGSSKFIVNKVFARINFGMPVNDDENEIEE